MQFFKNLQTYTYFYLFSSLLILLNTVLLLIRKNPQRLFSISDVNLLYRIMIFSFSKFLLVVDESR